MSRSPSTKRAKEVWKADYLVRRGDKLMNQFIAACDLGMTGVYYPEEYTVTFKAGVRPTKKRAEKVCDQIKAAWNKQKGVDCADVKFLRLYTA